MEYFSDRDEIILDFDKYYQNELKELIRDINKTMHLNLLLFSKKPNYIKNKLEYLILIFRSIDYLISATNLVRQRANIEAGVIIRLCIETSSMAFHINSDKKAFIKYKQNDYKSTESIKFTEKHIKNFGELWGSLSTLLVHPNTFHGILSELVGDKIEETATLNIGFKSKNEIPEKSMLILLRITANIILKCFELIITKKVKFKESEILEIEDFNMIMFSSTDSIIQTLIDKLKNNVI